LGFWFSLLVGFEREVKIGRQAQKVRLPVGLFAGVVLVLIIEIEFDVLAQGK
jgi:hypothetical protein